MSDHPLWSIVLNRPLVAALAAMFSSQLFKALKPLARGRLPRFRDISNYGGWPSSHTAFIVACAAAVGIVEGFDSSLFAVAATVGCILVYDILKMRRVVDLNAREVDRLLERSSLRREEEPPQFESHSLVEVAGGVLWGIAWAAAVCLLWPSA
jgi:acid phosphatase family membrane protein YuiD